MCDRGGACATFELLGGQLIIHSSVINSDATLPHAVLTNHTYKESLDHLQSLRGAQSLTGRGSLTRFVTAARSIAEPTPQPLDAALNALKRVEIKGYTKWQIAYDLKHQAVMFRTSNRSDVRQIKLTTLLESAPHHGRGCDATLTYPLNGRARGDLSGEFYKPKPERERRVLRQRYKRINLRVELSDKIAAHGARCLQ